MVIGFPCTIGMLDSYLPKGYRAMKSTGNKNTTAKFKTVSSLVAILLALLSFNASAKGCGQKCIDNFTHTMSINGYEGEVSRIYYKGWDDLPFNYGWKTVGVSYTSVKTLEFTALNSFTGDPQNLIAKGYCVDLDQVVGSGNYKVELKNLDLTSDWQKGAAWMMKNIRVNSGFEAAAMQIAIWEVVYDGIDSFNPDESLHKWWGGNFRVSGKPKYEALKDEALSYLIMLSKVTDYGNLDGYYLATNCWKQDMIVTPIPAAVWLMGSGLFGLIAVGRRRSSKEG
jgi:hypothetical protein